MRNWRAKLSPFQKRTYDRSTALTSIELTPNPQLFDAIEALAGALDREERRQVQAVSQRIVNHICWRLGVRSVRVQVQGVRPSNRHGELHGLYTQYNNGSRKDSIQVWMRTAKRGQVVAFRTYLRTLLHEVCHHLDYTYFGLRESYHTEGFFQRESSVFRVLVQPPAGPPAAPTASLLDMVSEIIAAGKQR